MARSTYGQLPFEARPPAYDARRRTKSGYVHLVNDVYILYLTAGYDGKDRLGLAASSRSLRERGLKAMLYLLLDICGQYYLSIASCL